ncbi:MAG: hypothetical protein ACPGYV_00460 [Phycisphaeraceae bacterium]
MSLMNAARSMKRKALRYRQGPRANLCLLGIRRGGSTVLADMVAGQLGVWFANEPFAVFDHHLNAGARLHRWLPRLPHSQFFDLDNEQTRQFDDYVALLNRGAIPIGTARKARFPLYADRACIKVLNAPFLADRFAQTHGMTSVFLTRHPAGQAQSILRQGWGFSAEAYFAEPDFLATYLTGEEIELGQRLLSDASDWEKAILNWWIENLYPLRHAASLALVVTYEELTLRAEAWVALLCEALSLDDPASMLAIANKPSNSSNMSTGDTVERIAAGDRTPLITGWQKKVSPDEVAQAQAILDAFGVTEYRMDDPMPSASLRRFAEVS